MGEGQILELNQIILIDKPEGWTSFDVVAKIRGKLRRDNPGQKIKVGHAGTLDPFATGLLIVLTGTKTKEQDSFMKQDKEYLATLELGKVSSTGDPEGSISEFHEGGIPTREQLDKVLKEFLGEIEQIPPKHSAIKVNGQRAYKLARNGEEFELKPRIITVLYLEVKEYSFPKLVLKVGCSSGTYIRTLAEDIGLRLGTGAYLTALRRTKIGQFDVSRVQDPEVLL